MNTDVRGAYFQFKIKLENLIKSDCSKIPLGLTHSVIGKK